MDFWFEFPKLIYIRLRHWDYKFFNRKLQHN